jgi:hypothetical protein
MAPRISVPASSLVSAIGSAAIMPASNAAVAAAFTDPATQRRFRDVGMELPSREQQTPEALYAHHKAEIDKWWPIIRAANIKAE